MLKNNPGPCLFRQLSKKAIAVVVSVSMLFTMVYLPIKVAAATPNWQDSGNVATSYAGGNGTASDPYQIATAEQLAYLAKTVNASAANTYDGVYFIQTGDIDLSGKEWTPIGMRVGDSQCYYLSKFDGYFNGDGYSINGLTINADLSDGYAYYGLFGVAQYGLLENINLTNVDISISGNNSSDSFYVGGLAGYLITGATNCHVSGTIDTSGSTNLSTGGLAGQTYYSASVIGCSSSCTILGSQTVSSGGNVGGILGENFGVIKNCFATGTITGDKSGSVGGIAGANSQSSTIENCYTNCAVSTAVNVGGIAGCSGGPVTNCYAAGSASDSTSTWVGGIVGNSYGTVSNCYYNSDNVIEDRNYSEVGMTTADMQASPFVTTMDSHRGSDYHWAADSGTSPVNSGFPVLVAPDIDATLSGLSVGTGSLSPAFSSDVTTYSESETAAVSSVNVTPTVSDTGKATVTVNGAVVTSGSAASVTVTPGVENDIRVVVTAENTSITRTYLIKVKDGSDIDAALSGLSLSAGSLSPTFSAAATSYNATIPSNTGSITVTPTVHDTGRATVTVNGASVASGLGSSAITLTPGAPITIIVKVTAEDGLTTKTYTIHATETPADATLSDLKVSEGTLSPHFDSSTTTYALTMPSNATGVTVTPTATDSAASISIKVNGTVVSSGAASGVVTLTSGTASDITVTVKGSDGIITNDYILHVQRVLPNWQDSGNVATSYAKGDGSSESPFQIASAEQLAYFAQQVNSGTDYKGEYFVLSNDINLADNNLAAYQWTPIGDGYNDFDGTFDGNGHTVSGITIGTSVSPNTILEYVGLFGNIGSDAVIHDIGINNASIYSNSPSWAEIGILAGENNGTITNCYADGNLSVTGDLDAGILVGDTCGTITGCYTTGSVTAKNTLSGLFSYNDEIGAFAGYNDSTITDCYSTASVTVTAGSSSTDTGGFVGYNDNTITGCYATGSVTVNGTNGRIGEFVGENYSTFADCYCNSEITDGLSAIGNDENTDTPQAANIIGLTTAQMTGNAATTNMSALMNHLGTDNKAIWVATTSFYPRLVKLTVTESFNSNGGSTVTPIQLNPYTFKPEIPADPTRSDYIFAGWYSDAALTQAFSFNTSITADTTLYAKWTSTAISSSGVLITGSAAADDSSGYTASVSSEQATNGSVTVTLGNVTVKDTGSVLSGLIGSNSGSSIRLTETPTMHSAEINTLAGSNSIVSAFDIDLFSVSSSGVSTQLHQLGGNLTITIALTDAQKAQITDPSTAKLYYYDPDTKSLVDMHAVFDMTAGTVTFTTNHLSTFVLEQGTVANPKTGGGNSPIIPSLLLGSSSISGLIIITKRKKWKVKSNTANK